MKALPVTAAFCESPASSVLASAMREKNSNAFRSSWGTPSPSAYIRPSFHRARAWPWPAAYSRARAAPSLSPALYSRTPARRASRAER